MSGSKQLFQLGEQFHGEGSVQFAWDPKGNFLATAGARRLLNIFDRRGELVASEPLRGVGSCSGLGWDCEGEVVAAIQEGSSEFLLWDCNTRKTTWVDANMRDLSFLSWAKSGPQLAIGNAKGNLLLYNRRTFKKTPVLRHSKKITSGSWSTENLLALGAEDNILSLSHDNGDAIQQPLLKAEPRNVQFSTSVQENRRGDGECLVSANLGGQCIFIFDTRSAEENVEIAFDEENGSITSYCWFRDGYLMVGFSTGLFVVISTHEEEEQEEIASENFFSDMLVDLSYCPVVDKGACVGDDTVIVVDMSSLGSNTDAPLSFEKIRLEKENRCLERCMWTRDGQILTVSSKRGVIYSFLMSIPALSASSGSQAAYLSSLRQISIKDLDTDTITSSVEVDIEPAFIGLGPLHVATGMNNHIWFYPIQRNLGEKSFEREYVGSVLGVQLSATLACVLTNGRVHLHTIDPSMAGDFPERTFPPAEEPADVTHAGLASEFLVYGRSSGSLHFFSLEDWQDVTQFRFDCGVDRVFPNKLGTRAVILDENRRGFLFNPVNNQVTPIPHVFRNASQVVWDQRDPHVFVIGDDRQLATYCYSPITRSGPRVDLCFYVGSRANRGVATVSSSTSSQIPPSLGEAASSSSRALDALPPHAMTSMPPKSTPLVLIDGALTVQTPGGSFSIINLVSHTHVGTANPSRLSLEEAKRCFFNTLNLNRLASAWKIANSMDSQEFWNPLTDKALDLLDIDIAIRVYRQLKQPSMVMALEAIKHVDERNFLAGMVSLLLGDYSRAQESFLRSSNHKAALDMRRDLMHWEQALRLADSMAPEQVPSICQEYAQQLEFKGEYQKALEMYSRAGTPESRAGLVRCTLRLGDVHRGMDMARESNNASLCKECAAILEDMKQYNEAGALYEEAEMYEKAAAIYVAGKNFAMAERLVPHINTPKLHLALGKAKESQGRFDEAVVAYERAQDLDAVVRLYLEKLNRQDQAFAVTRDTKSVDSANLVAQHCQTKGDWRNAIEFLLLAKRKEEAFRLAKEKGQMDTYATFLKDGTYAEYLDIAQFFESKGSPGKAGTYYCECGQYERALQLLIDAGEDYILQAIEVVGKAREPRLTDHLIAYLSGELDHVPKDANYVLKLYQALGNHSQAIRTACFIANHEQEAGNYKTSHDLLLEAYTNAKKYNVTIPSDLRRNLMLLHSYILVKPLAKTSHVDAARMLVRVAKNISRFPNHVVSILTSTVIECVRAGLRRSAYEYASLLMRPEYRDEINPKFKRKIETIVRKKRDYSEELEEPLSPCPFCQNLLPETELNCGNCKNIIAYDIVTGKHLQADDLCVCPHCEFPASYEAMNVLAGSGQPCPMCGSRLPNHVKRCSDRSREILSFESGPSAASAVTELITAASSSSSAPSRSDGVGF